MSQRMSHARRAAGLLATAAVACAIFASSAVAAGLQVQSVSAWKQNAAPMGWSSSLNRVFYNAKGSDGMFDAYSANPDGSDPQCLTCASPTFPHVGAATNRGVSDVSPDGRWMLLSVEESPHAGQIGATWTQPGKGGANDVWLASTDGSRAWPLADTSASGPRALGTNWARFNRTGTQIVWASMTSPAVGNLGVWQLKVADIVWNGGVPSLANIVTIDPDPGSFYEPYGFSPDDSHIIFASDAGQTSWMATQIDTIAADGTGGLTQLSPPEAPDGVFSEYNEFAFYVPGTNQIIYGRIRDATSGGLDYWEMNADGSGQQRLTFFNEPWSTQSMGYSVVGGLVFDPNDPDRVIAGVASDINAQNINAVTITLGSPDATQGLDAQYFSGQSFNQLVSSSIQNPSDGFVTTGSPASGAPASNYSIRWSGTLTAPVAGTYSLCAVVDESAQVYLAGNLLVNASNSFGQQRCAAAALPAGSPVAIVMTAEHLLGKAYAQLSWIPPGASTPSAIPSADLAPAAVAGPGGSPTAGPGAPAGAGPTTTLTAASTGATAGSVTAPKTAKPTATARRTQHGRRRHPGKRTHPKHPTPRAHGKQRGHSKPRHSRGHAARHRHPAL